MDAFKTDLFRYHKSIFDLLDFDDDDAFFNPVFQAKHIYKWYAPKVSIDQLYYGRIQRKLRPPELDIYSDKLGVVYLPMKGYFISNEIERHVTLRVGDDGILNLRSNEAEVDSTFLECDFYGSSRIEIVQYDNDVLRPMYNWRDPQPVDVSSAYSSQRETIVKALSIIEHQAGDFYKYLEGVVRMIVPFYSDSVRSFASGSSTGIDFVRCMPDSSLAYWIEEIIHQSSHNILYVLQIHLSEYFTIDSKNTALSNYTGNVMDKRTVFGAYHGVFSLVNIVTIQDRLLRHHFEERIHSLENAARLLSNLGRLTRGLHELLKLEIFTTLGAELLALIDRHTKLLYEKHRSDIETTKFAGQSYDFDLEIFLMENSSFQLGFMNLDDVNN